MAVLIMIIFHTGCVFFILCSETDKRSAWSEKTGLSLWIGDTCGVCAYCKDDRRVFQDTPCKYARRKRYGLFFGGIRNFYADLCHCGHRASCGSGKVCFDTSVGRTGRGVGKTDCPCDVRCCRRSGHAAAYSYSLSSLQICVLGVIDGLCCAPALSSITSIGSGFVVYFLPPTTIDAAPILCLPAD